MWYWSRRLLQGDSRWLISRSLLKICSAKVRPRTPKWKISLYILY
jgi:hypothetical protein